MIIATCARMEAIYSFVEIVIVHFILTAMLQKLNDSPQMIGVAWNVDRRNLVLGSIYLQ